MFILLFITPYLLMLYKIFKEHIYNTILKYFTCLLETENFKHDHICEYIKYDTES